MSATLGPCGSRPWNQRRRQNTGWRWRRRISRRVNCSRRSSARRPVVPGHLVVLAVAVVVAVLRAPDLVAAEQHRHALRQQQRREEVALLARAQRETRACLVGALDAAVPGAVVAFAVAVVLAVRLVVLVVVRHQVAQREAVVRGDEVDAGVRAPRGALVEVRAAGQPIRELGQRPIGAAPEVAHACRDTCRSTPTTAAGSCRPDSRPRRCPTARR